MADEVVVTPVAHGLQQSFQGLFHSANSRDLRLVEKHEAQ
jgi:hypothetical protein